MTSVGEAWKDSVVSYTRDLTEHGRRLGFAGFAVAWILRVGDFSFPLPVLLGMMLLCAFFLLDIIQYWRAATRNRVWLLKEEAERGLEGDFTARPGDLDTPIWRLWKAKLWALVLAYAFIGTELLRRAIAG